jgi:hypothetical protein
MARQGFDADQAAVLDQTDRAASRSTQRAVARDAGDRGTAHISRRIGHYDVAPPHSAFGLETVLRTGRMVLILRLER